MNPTHDYRELLRDRGIPLGEHGIGEMALRRVDALRAVDLLRTASIPVLGGDVYIRYKARVELAYANWHSEPEPGEKRQGFATRSCLETETYIRGFPVSEAEPLFVLVIDEGASQEA